MGNNSLLLVLNYKDPQYGRFRALVESAQSLPLNPVELLVTREKGGLRYLELLYKLWSNDSQPSVVLLGFRGYEIFWMLKAKMWRTPIIFDALVSPYLSWKHEKKTRLSLFLPLIYQLEKLIYRYSAAVLVDTEAHKQELTQAFSLEEEKVFVLPVGAEEQFFFPQSRPSIDFTVLYYFSGQKLHGEELLENLLEETASENIRYLLIGPTSHHFAAHTNVTALPFVPYHLLARIIAQADLCLCGPFGDSLQGEKVITTKTFQALAMGKCVVLGKNPSTQNFFQDKQNALVIEMNNQKALLDAVLWGYRNQKKLPEIGISGLETYRAHFSKKVRSQVLARVLTYVQNHS